VAVLSGFAAVQALLAIGVASAFILIARQLI
jgi:hypothetical protein